MRELRALNTTQEGFGEKLGVTFNAVSASRPSAKHRRASKRLGARLEQIQKLWEGPKPRQRGACSDLRTLDVSLASMFERKLKT